MKFQPGDIVIAVLQNPREKLLGVLQEVTPAGISIRAIDLDYFDDWSRAIASGEPFLPMSDSFYPMWRVERITRDVAADEIPSMSEQFELRTKRRFEDL